MSNLPQPCHRLLQFDGLRTWAVAAVAFSHWASDFVFGFPFGPFGVHLFFCLSGFLITGILLDIRDTASSRHVAMRSVFNFYMRRGLRLYPAYTLLLVGAVVAGIPTVRDDFLWHATYLSNFLFYYTKSWPGPISHFWSLAVEEQFYLVWPVIILLTARWALLSVLVVSAVFSIFFRVILMSRGLGFVDILMPSCVDSLALGAMGVVLVRGQSWQRWKTYVNSLLWLGPVWLVWHYTFGRSLMGWIIGRSLMSLFLIAIVLGAYKGFGGLLGRLLSFRAVIYLGQISYGLYLFHNFAPSILRLVESRLQLDNWLWFLPVRIALCSAITVGCAAVSWHLIELPVNRLKRRFPCPFFAANPE